MSYLYSFQEIVEMIGVCKISYIKKRLWTCEYKETLQETFPCYNILGCEFYLVQVIQRKIQNRGLLNFFEKIKENKLCFGIVLSTLFYVHTLNVPVLFDNFRIYLD